MSSWDEIERDAGEKLEAGDAKIAGVAHEVIDLAEIRTAWPEWAGQPHMADAGAQAFRIDVTEMVLVTVEGDGLAVTSWHPGRGVETRRR